ncbi:MAG TPA: OsmC family peroxiredoxin, partial [Thermoanaerobaculia bacterium]|nr:OsmC family peroxiredoxin [Thermoanaerobaculia bacterium]
MPTRNANAVWKGGLKDGSGQVALGSGAFSGPYSFASRFEQAGGTNPEELIGAAHAGCYSMALSAALEKAGHRADEVKTKADVTLDMVDGAPTITGIHLACEA